MSSGKAYAFCKINVAISDMSLGILPATVRKLREAGIHDALALREKAHSAEVGALSIDQLTVLEHWWNDLEQNAQAEWRKRNVSALSSPKPMPAEAESLRLSIAEFERHVAALKQERDLFPEASFGAYLQKLVGAGGKDATPATP